MNMLSTLLGILIGQVIGVLFMVWILGEVNIRTIVRFVVGE